VFPADGIAPSVHNNSFYLHFLCAKEKNNEDAQSNAVNGGHGTRSGRSGNGYASKLLRLGRVLRLLFRLRKVADP
jgi:hypothetical protein